MTRPFHGLAWRATSQLAFSTLALFLLAALAWASGGDPWKTKPFQQWDNKDVQRILNDSPWGKVVRVDAPWKGAGADADSSGGDRSMRGMQPTMSGQPTRDVGAPSGVPGANGGGQQIAQAVFLVRWVSSRTIREAAYRAAVLGGQMKEADAEKQASEPVSTYRVLIGGSDMKPFDSVDQTSLKGGVWLSTKKTKQKIPYTDVEIERSDDGTEVRSLIFSFPKKSDTGESTIASDEKTVEFNLLVGAVRIQVTFDIAKMDDSLGRDL
jgi:hypothetical protein